MVASSAFVTAARAAVEAVAGVAEAIEAQLIGVAEERQIPKSEGAASTTAWFASATRVSKPAAARTVKTAQLGEEGTVLAAWSAGIVSGEQVRVIVEALDQLP